MPKNPSISSSQLHSELPQPSPDSIAPALAETLAPLNQTAETSANLIQNSASFSFRDSQLEIPSFLLLGERGGDRPIRVALFAGFEAQEIESVRWLTTILLRLNAAPGLLRDFALMGYPVVNPRAFTDPTASLSELESRFASDSVDPVVRFYQKEFRKWMFSGVIHLRPRPQARHLHVTVRSEVIASEVVHPAILAVEFGNNEPATVTVRPGDRYARLADFATGRFGPPSDVRPYPFEIELGVPTSASSADPGEPLFQLLTTILRLYRTTVAHSLNL